MAIVIFTSYELNNFNVDSEYEKRTSQNMIFEAGYFLGKLGKKNSIILLEQGLSIPSIFNGYTYFEIDQEERWKLDIAKKLKKIS